MKIWPRAPETPIIITSIIFSLLLNILPIVSSS